MLRKKKKVSVSKRLFDIGENTIRIKFMTADFNPFHFVETTYLITDMY